MTDEPEDDVMVDDDAGAVRWIPAAVVASVLAGFLALAWYAYHSGSQSVKDEDLLVVEADKTPMKEKPLDPGGMQIPNQDKTVFDTYNNEAQNPPKVERVMPPPEEPMAKPADAGDTKTWVNDKLKDEAAAPDAKPEQVIGDASVKHVPQPKEANPAAGDTHPLRPPVVDKPMPDDNAGIVTHVAKHAETPSEKPAAPASKTTTKPVALQKPKTAEKPAAHSQPGAATARVQLGAYASEEEAKAAWGKILKKFPELKGKTVYVVKADLGAKGTFYRLRAGVASAADAKALCAKLTAKGQACLLAN